PLTVSRKAIRRHVPPTVRAAWRARVVQACARLLADLADRPGPVRGARAEICEERRAGCVNGAADGGGTRRRIAFLETVSGHGWPRPSRTDALPACLEERNAPARSIAMPSPTPPMNDGQGPSNDDIREIALLLQPLAPVRRPLLREQHVEDLIRPVVTVHRQLHEPPRIGRHRRLAQ